MAVKEQFRRELAVFSPGLLRLRGELHTLTGLRPARAYPLIRAGRWAAVAGWGHKPTADTARAFAARSGLPFIAFEDGFLRSIRPGRGEPPSSLVVDRTGIYYDARGPSDLESMLQEAAPLTPAEQTRAHAAIEVVRRHRITKYNAGPDRTVGANGLFQQRPGKRVLLVDQTFGDASIPGGLSDHATFGRMVEAAVEESPGAQIVAKMHPEVVSGAKRGYLAEAAARGATIQADPVNPWALIDQVDKVYTVSSQFGFDALLGGRDVVCFGMPFYAGWGLTDDRVACERRTRRLTLAELVHAAFFRYCRYFDAWTRDEVDFFTAVEQLVFLRERYLANSTPFVGYRITPWKRKAVSRMVEGPGPPPRFHRSLAGALVDAKASGARLLAWGATARRIAPAVRDAGVGLATVEDGFLRSVGLGASFTPSSSYVFDLTGIYYDPRQSSDLERILASTDFDAALLDRARVLIREIVSREVTKYNIPSDAAAPPLPQGREMVLVPGQVADDESILLGAADLSVEQPLKLGGANLALLRRVRARHPHAFIVYRPHPDVEAGLRAGRIPPELANSLADLIDTGPSIAVLLRRADRVETATSLAGFEGLLRGRRVAVHGQPFYAGWGLTEDINPIKWRTRCLSLEQLVAGALILYPRYLDPLSGRPCPPEVLIEMLSRIREERPSLHTWLRSRGGRALARTRHLIREARRRVSPERP